MNLKKKVIIAHPHKQHSFQLARALKEEGVMYKYITNVYDKKHSVTRLLKHFLKGNNLKKANGKKTDFLDDSEIKQYNEIFGLLLIFLSRFSKLKWLWNKLDYLNADIFGRKVAKYAIKNQVDAIICYDNYCTACFKYIKRKKANIICIMDVSIANRLYMKKIFENDINNTTVNNLLHEEGKIWKKSVINRIKTEIELTDYFLVASNFVKKSLEYSNVDKKKIFLVPYGVDLNKFHPKKHKKNIEKNKPIKLVYVGQINYRKGLHHLLEIISKYDSNEVIIDLVGRYTKNSKIYSSYSNCKNINFLGFVTRDIIEEKYNNADAFIIASLAEGFALVILEALASGLPVICSSNSGGNDAIENYKNGIVFEAGNDDELKSSIDWMISNKNNISKLKEYAYKTSLNYSWEIYHKKIKDVMNIILK